MKNKYTQQNQLKKIILFAVLTIVFTSCKKNNSITPTNTITATINDTVYTFNTITTDTSLSNPNYNEIYMTAADTLYGAKRNLRFLITTPIATPFIDSTYDNITTIGYGPEFSFGTSGASSSYTSVSRISTPFVVTITKLTNTSLQGVFEGTVYYDEDSTQQAEIVTNGKFDLNK
jgi:hypothetical protein